MSLFDSRTVAKGIYLCLQNARDLIEEAKILCQHDRYARAFSLSVLAFEELGKVDIIVRNFISPDTKNKKRRFIKEFKTHSAKQLTAIITHFAEVLIGQGEEELKKQLETASDSKNTLDIMKQKGLYVDVVGDDFSSPRNFDEKLAKELVEKVEGQIYHYEQLLVQSGVESLLVEFKKWHDEGGKPPELAEELSRIIRDVRESQE